METNVTAGVLAKIEKIKAQTEKLDPQWGTIFEKCYKNTLQTTVKKLTDGTTFVLTGDIPAMWLRDSTAQVMPYLTVAKEDQELRKVLTGLVKRQIACILVDPYANAFNETENGASYHLDETKRHPLVWERKYEVDSLCYPIQLAYKLWQETGETSHLDVNFFKAVEIIVELWITEQHHEEKSEYRFERDTWRKEDTLVRQGRGPVHGYTGMTWSAFRPSDDACLYSYLIPANMFAVVVLGYLAEILQELQPTSDLLTAVLRLQGEIKDGIETFGVVKNAAGEKVYAYEVDGLGNYSIMDDSNVPSLMSAPYLGYCDVENQLYQKTRGTLLSPENPYFYTGKYAQGIGSSHTPENYIWPIALAIQGLTAKTKTEQEGIIKTLVATTGGTNLMHEGFDVDNPANFTRDWFSWANMMFCQLVLTYCEEE